MPPKAELAMLRPAVPTGESTTQAAVVVAAAKLRAEAAKRIDLGGTNRDTRKKVFEALALETYVWLDTCVRHPDGGQLCSAAQMTLTSTSQSFWDRKRRTDGSDGGGDGMDGGQSRLDTLGLRRRRRRGHRTAEQIPIGQLRETRCGCPSKMCLAQTEDEVLQYFAQEHAVAGTDEGRWGVLKDVLIGVPGVCDDAVSKWLGVSRTTVIAAHAQAHYTSERQQHGNIGKIAANRIPAYVRQAIRDHLDTYMWVDPAGGSTELSYRRPTNPEVAGRTKMWEVFQAENDGAVNFEGGPLSESTFQRYITAFNVEDCCKMLGCSSEHCKCPTCKTLEAKIVHTHQLKMQASLRRIQDDVDQSYAAQHVDALLEYRAHLQKDTSIRAMSNGWKYLARAAAQQLSTDECAEGSSFAAQIYDVHVDDKSSAQVPRVPSTGA
eukprot:SAG31_NODE_2806_length_5066_cov_8.018321_2_plen_435_part_00